MLKPLEPSECPSPWLAFFRRVRVLAARLDALEAGEQAAQEEGTERRDSART